MMTSNSQRMERVFEVLGHDPERIAQILLEKPDEYFTEYQSKEEAQNHSLFWLACQIYKPLSWVLIETARLVDGYEDHESKRRQIVDEFEAPAAIRRSADRYPTGYQTAIKHLTDKTLTSLFQAVKYNEVLRSTALDQLKRYQNTKRNKAIWIQHSKLDKRSYPFLQDKPTITRRINGNLTVQDVVDRVPMAQLQGGVVVEYNIMRLAIEQSIDD